MRTRRPFPGPRKYRDVYGDVLIDGYTFMGRTQQYPNKLAMVDHTTLQTMVLDVVGGAFTITPLVPGRPNVTTFGPNDGPYTNQYRLILDNGVLSAVSAPGYNSQRVIAFEAPTNTTIEITVNPANGQVVYTTL